jgi:opacity protein-like surface antigen
MSLAKKERTTMCKSLYIACAVLVFASLAAAQAPTSGNVFFGYSYYNADLSSLGRSNLNGWTASLEGKVSPHVGLVADFSQTFGSESVAVLCPGPPCPNENLSAHEYNMLFGPRLSVSVGKLRPFAEALFGVGHIGTNGAGSNSNTSFATGLGGGIDYRLFRPIALRFEGDYVQTRFFSSTQNNVRLSTGIVFRF